MHLCIPQNAPAERINPFPTHTVNQCPEHCRCPIGPPGAAAPTNAPSPAVGNAFMHSAKCTRGTDDSVPYAHRRPHRRAGCPHPAGNMPTDLPVPIGPPGAAAPTNAPSPIVGNAFMHSAKCTRGTDESVPYAPANQCPEHCRCPNGPPGAAAPTNTPSPAVGNAFMHFAKCTRRTDQSVPYAPANQCPEHCRCPNGPPGRRPLQIHHHPP